MIEPKPHYRSLEDRAERMGGGPSNERKEAAGGVLMSADRPTPKRKTPPKAPRGVIVQRPTKMA